jgi:hypothetical protein
MSSGFPAVSRVVPSTRGETRRWLLILAVSVALGVTQAAVLVYHALYEFAPYPIPEAVGLTVVVGALWYRWTTTFRETVASFTVLVGVTATVLMAVFTSPARLLGRQPPVSAFPIVERAPFGRPADVILQVAGFRTLLLLFLAVPILLVTGVLLTVLHSETSLGERFGRRGSLSVGLVVVTVAATLLAGGGLAAVTGNYVSVVDQNEASMAVEGVAVSDGEVTVTVDVPNRLDGPMAVESIELFLYVDGHGWEATTDTVGETVPAGETAQFSVTFPSSDLDPELVCGAESVRVDGLVSATAFDHYAETFPVSETTVDRDAIDCG